MKAILLAAGSQVVQVQPWDEAGPTMITASGPWLAFRKRGYKTKGSCKDLRTEAAMTLLEQWKHANLDTLW